MTSDTTTTPALDQLLNVASHAGAIPSRGGFYSPQLNVWVDTPALELFVAGLDARERAFVEHLAQVAILGGALHRQMLADAREGRVWPAAWLQQPSVDTLRAATAQCPTLPDPLSVVRLAEDGTLGTIPYSRAYAGYLEPIAAELAAALALDVPIARPLHGYLQALVANYRPGAPRESDLAAHHAGAEAWVDVPPDAPLLLLAEFTESYSDPLEPLLASDSGAADWAQEHEDRQFLDPWRAFWEMRLMRVGTDALAPHELAAIRKTNARLYGPLVDEPPATQNASLEFRYVLWVSGHGAHPPKTAKNYPNFSDVRQQVGYKNTVYINQAEVGCREELAPLVRASFDTPWSRSEDLVSWLVRGRVLAVAGHEENHPWLRQPAPWLEELKSTVFGLHSIVESGEFSPRDLQALFASEVGAALHLAVRHHEQLRQGDRSFERYYTGDVVFLNLLLHAGALRLEGERVVDLDFDRFPAAVAAFIDDVVAIYRLQKSAAEIRAEWFDEDIWSRFPGLL